MTLSNLTAYTNILEGSAATPGLFDVRFSQADANIRAVDAAVSQVSSMLSGSGISGLRDVTLTRYGGALGDGTTDDRAAFITGATSTQTQAILYAPSAASVYRIASASNITGAYQPIPGAVLRPTSGTTIRISGAILAGSYPWLDTSLGGGADFTANGSIHYHDARWYGITGDGTTDDQPALTRMVATIPDYSTVQFPSNMVMKLGSTWTVSARKGLRFVCLGSPFPDGANAAQFKWQGGAGGTMMAISSCDACEVHGFFFNMGPSSTQYATVGIDLDVTGTNGATGTRETIAGNLFNVLQSSSTSYSCIQIGRTASGNQEYHNIVGNHFFGAGFMLNANNGATVTASGSTATINGTTSLSTGSSYRVRIAGGAGPVGLDTTGVAISTSALTLASASSAVTAAFVIVGQQYGNAIKIICSQSKGIYIHDNYMIGFARGIWMVNGSFLCFKNNFNNNESDLQLDSATESCEDHFSNTEQSRQHAVFTTAYSMPTRFQSCRWSGLCATPNTGWIEVGGSAMPLEVDDCEFDSAPASGTSSSAYSFLANFNGSFRAAFNRYAGGWTSSQVGYTGVDALGNVVYPRGLLYRVESVGETGITGWPPHWVSGDSAMHRGIDVAGVGLYEVRTGGAVIDKHIGLIGRALRDHLGNSADVLVGIQGQIAKDAGGGGLVNFTNKQHSVEAALFNGDTEGFTVIEMDGFHVVAPVLSGGGSGATIRGLVVEDLRGGGGATTPTNTYGVVQSGLSDPNQFNSWSYFTAGSAPLPSLAFSSESSLGLYRSGAATIAPSLGTFNLAANSVRLSVRTLASGDSTNIAVNEALFIIGGASGASIGIRSGGTIYYFASSASTKG